MSWLKRGKDAKKLEDTRSAMMQGDFSMFRFSLERGEEAPITFVDGDLNDEGELDQPRIYEHMVNIGGKWKNILCKALTNPEEGHTCPICESYEQVGDNKLRASLIAFFTIVDHRNRKSSDGQKSYKDQQRLFAAKPKTYELLTKLAKKRGGLCGVKFDVSRSNEKNAASVGDLFDFVEKGDPAKLHKLYQYEYEKQDGTTVKGSRFEVADYEKEIVVMSEDELRAAGFGKGGVKSKKSDKDEDDEDYGKQM